MTSSPLTSMTSQYLRFIDANLRRISIFYPDDSSCASFLHLLPPVTKTNNIPGDCLRTWDRIVGGTPRAKIEPAQVRKKVCIYKGQAGFELATFRLRKGIQQGIAASERSPFETYSIPGELDTTDTHTPTPEVPRRTSLVRNLRRPWAPREHSPERTKRKTNPNLLPWFPPPNAAVLGACYPV